MWKWLKENWFALLITIVIMALAAGCVLSYIYAPTVWVIVSHIIVYSTLTFLIFTEVSDILKRGW